MLLNIRSYVTEVTPEALDDINDPDLKRELASAQTQLISYSEL
jgi:hypothetical protein